jgi:hypothetical protein
MSIKEGINVENVYQKLLIWKQLNIFQSFSSSEVWKFLTEVVYDERDECLAMRIVCACEGYVNVVVSSVSLGDMLFRRKEKL